MTIHEGEAMILNARSLRSPGSGGRMEVSCDLLDQCNTASIRRSVMSQTTATSIAAWRAAGGVVAADDARGVTLVSLDSCRDRDGRCLL